MCAHTEQARLKTIMKTGGVFFYGFNDIGKPQSLRNIINSSDNMVFFGGAGVSTESNIPDFRGSGGLTSNEVKQASSFAGGNTVHTLHGYIDFLSITKTNSYIIRRKAQRRTFCASKVWKWANSGCYPPKHRWASISNEQPGVLEAAWLRLRNYCVEVGEFAPDCYVLSRRMGYLK